MIRLAIIALAILAGSPAISGQPDIRAIVEIHVLPRYQALVREASELADRTRNNCSASNPNLIAAFHDAFDAWVGVSHLRFGPSERNDRAFALAFWPDPRGSTPKALTSLIQNEDPAITTAETFSKLSIAARGFYALEFLLFDPKFEDAGSKDYHCSLVQSVAVDIQANSAAILSDWENGYADLIANPGNETYRTSTEATQQFFTVLSTGLEFTSQARLGRPMGTFDRPRPKRAEAWRSKRSLRHVIRSLIASRELAQLIAVENERLDHAFDRAIEAARRHDDPAFAGVATPQGRIKVEILRQKIDDIRDILAQEVGPSLGFAAGFNSLDGD